MKHAEYEKLMAKGFGMTYVGNKYGDSLYTAVTPEGVSVGLVVGPERN